METLINRVRQALAFGMTGAEVAKYFKSDASPHDVFLAYHAARILLNDNVKEIHA